MSKLIQLYTSILEFSGLSTDVDGYIYTNIQGELDPLLIEGKKLVLPTNNQLRTSSQNKVVFHPLTEDIFSGESKVIEKFNHCINVRLNYAFVIVARSLISLAASPQLHSKLNPDQLELLTSLKEVDITSVKNFNMMTLSGFKTRPERSFINIYLKKGGKVKDVKYSRAGIVTFPAYKELLDESKLVLDTKIRVKDRKVFTDIYKFIFPDIDILEVYNSGSDSLVAPYLVSLMKTALGIARRLNDVVSEYSDFIEDHESIAFNGDWIEDFNDLSLLVNEIRKVPPQESNVAINQPQEQAYNPQKTPNPYPYQTSQAFVPQPEIRRSSNGLDFDSIKNVLPYINSNGNAFSNTLAQQLPPPFAYNQAPQFPQPGYAPPGMVWDPYINNWVPAQPNYAYNPQGYR